MLSDFVLKHEHLTFYVMGLCISFKPSVLADFFWHCSSKEWEAVALLVSDHGRCPISHLASINPRDIGEVLLLTEGRGWEFSLPNKLSLIFHRLGKCRNASLLLIVWPILMPQSAVWNPWISTASPLKIHQWEYGVLLLGRGRNIGILPPPWSLLIPVEDRKESCYPMMDWYCFLFRMLPLLA